MPGFGRIPHWDQRNENFLVRDAPRLQALPLRGHGWPAGPLLDQGNEGTCVGHGFAGELGATPVRVKPADHALALAIFDRAAVLDPFPGTSRDDGTTVLAGVKASQEMGYYGEYRWALTTYEMALAIGYEGPVVIGVAWREGMMDVDRDGYVRATGPVVGGHCVYVRSYSLAHARFTLRNSWGAWGRDGTGDAYISEFDMATLLEANGECCVPVGRARP